MLALYEKGLRPPASLSNSSCPIYSEQALPPLALIPATEEEVSSHLFYILPTTKIILSRPQNHLLSKTTKAKYLGTKTFQRIFFKILGNNVYLIFLRGSTLFINFIK